MKTITAGYPQLVLVILQIDVFSEEPRAWYES